MNEKREISKTWIYVIALVVILILFMTFFGDKIAFSPKNSGDKIVSASDRNGINLLGLDQNIDRKEEQKMANAFRKAVSGGK